jgi:hypothetical protein
VQRTRGENEIIRQTGFTQLWILPVSSGAANTNRWVRDSDPLKIQYHKTKGLLYIMNKTLKTVLISVFATLSVCCVIVAGIILVPGILSTIQMQPVYEITDTFMTDLKAGNYESAITYLSQDTLQKVGNPDNLPSYFGIQKTINTFKRGISIESTNGERVEVSYGVIYADNTEGAIWLVMVKNSDTWKITGVTVKSK